MKTVLASASPRRRETFEKHTYGFFRAPFFGGGKSAAPTSPLGMSKSLAALKACEVARLFPDATVIGADTVVVFGGRIIGKPKDEKQAFDILKELSGKTHSVYTGVCVVRGGKEKGVCAKKQGAVFSPYGRTDKLLYRYRFAYGQGGRLRHTGQRLCQKNPRQLFQCYGTACGKAAQNT